MKLINFKGLSNQIVVPRKTFVTHTGIVRLLLEFSFSKIYEAKARELFAVTNRCLASLI